MLQTQTVNAQLLELLKHIMLQDTFRDFVLVGGTSLALQEGHRKSIDIDMFGAGEIDDFEFTSVLNTWGSTVILKKSQNIIIYSVNGIKVDFVNYKYPWLSDILENDGIRMASKKDIAAMKLNAILGRGSKKDFIDMYVLLQTFTFEEMIGFYNQKYHDGSEFLLLKSLTYFDDADAEEMPEMLIEKEWDDIKKTVKETAESYLKKI